MSDKAEFSVGQLIRHKLFRYRGVIADIDSVFSLSDAWYERMAKTRPSKDRPWYHVLVDGAEHQTYVAERNLEPDPSKAPIRHPLVELFFDRFENGIYVYRSRIN